MQIQERSIYYFLISDINVKTKFKLLVLLKLYKSNISSLQRKNEVK